MSFWKKITRGITRITRISLSIATVGTLDLAIKGLQELFRIKPPKPPKGLENGGQAFQSQLQQNLPRLGDEKPIGAGRWRAWHCLDAEPYSEFEGDEQVYCAVMHVTTGRAVDPEMMIAERPFASFLGARYEWLLPGEPLTLIHPNVYTSPDVKGIEMAGGALEVVTFSEPTADFIAPDRIADVVDRFNGARVGGFLTISDAGAGYDGLYEILEVAEDGDWVRVDTGGSPFVSAVLSATFSFLRFIGNADAILAKDVAITFAGSNITLPSNGAAKVQIGDLVGVLSSPLNGATTFTVTDSNADDTLTVSPAPAAESLDSASLVLLRRTHGPIRAQLRGKQCTDIAVDIFAGALGKQDSKGKIKPRSVDFLLRWREIDSTGAAIGSWVDHPFTITDQVFKPRRKSIKVTLPSPMAVEVTLARLTPETDDGTVQDAMIWGGLKGYMTPRPGTTPEIVPDCTRVAVRLRSSGLLDSVQERSFNSYQTRELPVPDGEDWVMAPSRNVYWFALLLLLEESQGLIDADEIDMPAFAAYAAASETRGVTFDAYIDRPTIFWDLVQSVMRADRAKLYRHPATGLLTIYRDEPTPPAMMFGDGVNCMLGGVNFETPDSDLTTGIRTHFTDPVSWKLREDDDAPLVGSDEDPRVDVLFGCSSWTLAYLEAWHLRAVQRYRTLSTSIQTEMAGLLAKLGARTLLASRVMGWGQAARATSAQGRSVIVWPPFEWTPGAQHYVYLEDRDGRPGARINCTRGGSDGAVQLAEDPDVAYRDADDTIPMLVLFGHDGTETVPASGPLLFCVEGMEEQGRVNASLSLRIEDARVHELPEEIPADPLA